MTFLLFPYFYFIFSSSLTFSRGSADVSASVALCLCVSNKLLLSRETAKGCSAGRTLRARRGAVGALEAHTLPWFGDAFIDPDCGGELETVALQSRQADHLLVLRLHRGYFHRIQSDLRLKEQIFRSRIEQVELCKGRDRASLTKNNRFHRNTGAYSHTIPVSPWRSG